jgi:predicted nucleotidyltransferase
MYYMHTKLKELFDRSVELFKSNQKILGMWDYGSAGKTNEDEYSDVDPVILVNDGYYDKFRKELPGLFKKLAPGTILFWEEFNQGDVCNNAILIKLSDNHVLQYDIGVIKKSAILNDIGKIFLRESNPTQILFDKHGTIKQSMTKVSRPIQLHDKLLWTIEKYWVYAYICVKYLWRKDIFKLLYVQEVLFQTHLDVLKMLYPKSNWTWWPATVKKLFTKQKQAQLLTYFGANDVRSLNRAIRQEIKLFSKDAKQACRRYRIKYPANLESTLKQYISRNQ